MLDIRGVRKRFGDTLALDGVDLRIAPGEVCGLLGRNGAGKTTLLSIVTGLLRPDEGAVLVGGDDVRRYPYRARSRIGYVPQDLGIYPMASVRENLLLFGELAGLRRQDLRTRVEEVAAALGLTALMDRKAGLLSGGQQRRLHTAMGILHRPPLVLLDEPTVGADVETRAALLEFVSSLTDDGAAVCYSTHYLQEIETLDASVALIDAGRIIARGTVRGLIEQHGGSVVELEFDGDAPDVALDADVSRDGPRLRIHTREPAATAAQAIVALGPDAARLRGVELMRPSLESVFIALTGRRFDANGTGGSAVPSAAAPAAERGAS